MDVNGRVYGRGTRSCRALRRYDTWGRRHCHLRVEYTNNNVIREPAIFRIRSEPIFYRSCVSNRELRFVDPSTYPNGREPKSIAKIAENSSNVKHVILARRYDKELYCQVHKELVENSHPPAQVFHAIRDTVITVP